MADCELEDGEVLDSDTDDTFTSGAQAQVPRPLTHAEPMQRYRNPSIYRDRKQAVMSSSNSDDDSDEEKFLWKQKRLKYAAAKERNNSRDSKSSTTDHSNVVSSWPPTHKSSGFSGGDILKPKKKKDIWGSVLQEQTLSHGFIGFDMEQKGYNDRSVEAYSFKRAESDTRPWYNLETEAKEVETKNGDLFNDPPDLDKLEENFMGVNRRAVKRKHTVKERLGPRQFNKHKSRSHYKVTASDPVNAVAEAVAGKLQEPKVDLILRVVQTMGRKKTLELAYITEDIEDSGGMLTNNGARRRTPGGVFFQMLKTDPSFTKDKMKAVFGEEMKKEAKRKKKLRATRIKLSLHKKNNISAEDEDAMEMETAADASQSMEEHQSKNDSLDDCDDENSRDASRGSSEASNCPDPATMDLSALLKHHVERRLVEEEEEEEKKAAASAEHKEERIENQSAEMQPKQSLPFLEPDICLDDESEMTFDL